MGSEPIRIDFVCGTPVKVSESGGFLSGLTCVCVTSDVCSDMVEKCPVSQDFTSKNWPSLVCVTVMHMTC